MSHAIQTAAAVMALSASLAAPLTADAAEALRVVRDPVTGELRGPTAAEAAAFAKAEAQLRAANNPKAAKAPPPQEILYPDGTVELKTTEDDMMYSVVAEAGDGSLKFDCLPAKAAQKFVKNAGKKAPVTKTAAKASHDHQ